MSRSMPYYSIDKVAATISIDAKSRAKWDKRADKLGKTVTTVMAEYLESAVREDPFTEEDLKRANDYMTRNIKNRENRKARKGIK